MENEVNIGLSKADPGTLMAFLRNTSYPFVSMKLELREIKGKYVPVAVFTSGIDDEQNEELQRQITEKLKVLIIEELSIPLRFQLNPGDPICAKVVKDNKNLIIPLPDQPKTENSELIVPSTKIELK